MSLPGLLGYEARTFSHVHLGRDHATLGPGVAGVTHGAAHVVDRVAHGAAEGMVGAAVAPLHLVPALAILRRTLWGLGLPSVDHQHTQHPSLQRRRLSWRSGCLGSLWHVPHDLHQAMTASPPECILISVSACASSTYTNKQGEHLRQIAIRR